MEIQRTANAGVLLKIDGVSILLDGLADRVEGYLPTPAQMAERLLENPPDILNQERWANLLETGLTLGILALTILGSFKGGGKQPVTVVVNNYITKG